jgi:hypothetical protein
MTKEVKERQDFLDKEYSENGKYEVKELSYKLNEKTYSCIIRIDFDLIRKAELALLDTNFSNAGKDAKVNVSIDVMGAGDKVLFFGWHSGDEEIKKNFKLRTKATRELGMLVQDLTKSDEELSEKKS